MWEALAYAGAVLVLIALALLYLDARADMDQQIEDAQNAGRDLAHDLIPGFTERRIDERVRPRARELYRQGMPLDDAIAQAHMEAEDQHRAGDF